MKTYELHGLRVRSDYALASPVETDLCDLEVRRGAPGAIADEPPDGEVLARLDLPYEASIPWGEEPPLEMTAELLGALNR